MPRELSENDVDALLERVRIILMALPEVTERPSHSAPTWFVRDKKTICNFWDNHHDDGIVGLWCAAPHGVQHELVEMEPERFYRPPYVGHRGWLGVRLDVEDLDWDEVAHILTDAYRCVAPKTLVKLLDDPPS